MASRNDRWLSWVQWGLTVLVLPLAIAGFDLRTSVTLQEIELRAARAETAAVEARLRLVIDANREKIDRCNDGVQTLREALARIETSIPAVKEKIDDLLAILRPRK